LLRIDSIDRAKFPEAPEKYFLNKKVSVTGVITDYKGVSLIKLSDNSMITIDPNDPGIFKLPETTGEMVTGRKYNFGKESINPPASALRYADTSRRKPDVSPVSKMPTDTTTKATGTTASDTIVAKPIDTIPVTVISPTVISQPVVESVEAPDRKTNETVSSTNKDADTTVVKNATLSANKRLNRGVNTAKRFEPIKKDTVAVASTVNQRKFEPIIKDPVPVRDTVIKAQETPIASQPVVIADTIAKVIDTVKVENPVAVETIKETDPVTTPGFDTTRAWLNKVTGAEYVPSIRDVRVVQKDVPIYIAAATSSPVIALLKYGMTISVLYVSQKWSYIVVLNPDNSEGAKGFIRNKSYKNFPRK
jgi:hypothetical protein